MWFINLFTQQSVAHTIIIYALVITLGVLLGKIKIGTFSLGVTFVLFVGIAVAHFGFSVDPMLLNFIKEFGLIIFIFCLGIQVGPSFFSYFKQDGSKFNLMAITMVGLGIITTFIFYFALQGRITFPMIVGVMSGAVTNTPGLGAAQEALRIIGNNEPIALGYAVAYPLGVIAVIAAMITIRLIFRIDINKENELAEQKAKNSIQQPCHLTIRMTNAALNEKTVLQCKQLIGRQFIISRMQSGGTEAFIPAGDTPLHIGDEMRVVCTPADKEAILAFFGEQIHVEWEKKNAQLVSRRIIITQNSINGKAIGDLHLRTAYGLNITRVNRSGIDLLASPELELQVGDRVMVVGELEAIAKVEKLLGNTLKRLDNPHIITLFLGIFLGIIVGSIPIYFPNAPMPAKLGLAGGPLIVAILIGRFGYKLHLITYTTQSANLMLREIGICLFLASVGLASGDKFVETVLTTDGLIWIGVGAAITFLPVLITGIIARLALKLNYLTIMGILAGASTNPTALAYASAQSNNDHPAIAYSTVYPLTMFLRIICAQFMILLMM
ncbi:MAG: putative transporter [Paludibacteraceae bacterium]|nr:putative transporter [Paludibacteraceae bacterium]